MLIFFERFKRKHRQFSTFFLVASTFVACTVFSQRAYSDAEYRIGFAGRPQYIYLSTTNADDHLGGLALKAYFTRHNHWEAGVSTSGNFGLNIQLYKFNFEHTFFIGDWWGDPRWLLRGIFGFDLLVNANDSIDRGGFDGGGAFGFRWQPTWFKGNIDTYLGGFYASFGSNVRGYAIELSMQWSFETHRDQ